MSASQPHGQEMVVGIVLVVGSKHNLKIIPVLCTYFNYTEIRMCLIWGDFN